MAVLAKGIQVLQIQLNNPFPVEHQRKFWKKIHRMLSQNGGWWNLKQRRLWIDLVYRPGEIVAVYLSIPQQSKDKITSLLTPTGRRKSILGNATHYEVDRSELFIPKQLSVCELKLAYENLFSLSHAHPVELPLSLSLEKGEMARVSFCIEPVIPKWQREANPAIKEKTEKGLVRLRDNRRIGLISIIATLLHRFFKTVAKNQVETHGATSWLSQETLKKWNDCHFKTVIRIAGPQRLLPKLSRPFQALEGENKLHIHFLSRKDNEANLRELNRHKLGSYSKRDMNPNIMSSRELIAAVPILSFRPLQEKTETLPNIM